MVPSSAHTAHDRPRTISQPIGFDDYLLRGDGVVVIEWADRILAALPNERLEIFMRYGDGDCAREIELRSFGARARLVLAPDGNTEDRTRFGRLGNRKPSEAPH